VKTIPAAQVPLIEKEPEPIYFAHIFLSGETLYFSDRNFTFNGHRYEAYLLDIPETVYSVEHFAGYLNINATLTFRNQPFRTYAKLFDFFLDNPITKREMDLYVLYLRNGAIPVSDDSILLHKVSFGEAKQIKSDTFEVELFSILYSLDHKKVFTQINRTLFPDAAPSDIGKFANRCIGSIRDVPCHCIITGAVSTLAVDTAAGASTIYLTEVDYPLAFTDSGQIQLGYSYITYTGRNTTDKTLTGCTWTTPARAAKRGEPVWQKKTSYKFLVDIGQIKSVTNVKAGGVKIATADRTVNLNDSGRTTIAVTERNLLKNQGAHSHVTQLSEISHPTGGSFTYHSGMAASGTAPLMYDEDEETYCHVGVTGTTSEHKDATFQLTFPTYQGYPPDSVYVNIVCDWQLGIYCNEYFRLTAPETHNIGVQGYSIGKNTTRFKLSSTTPPTTLTFVAYTDQGSPTYPCQLLATVYEVWLELQYDSLPQGGENDVWSKLAPLVTCDVDGYKDDGSGTYTGSASALIENPSDVLRYFLIGILGRSAADIGTSFDDLRTVLDGLDFKLAGLLNKLGRLPSEIARSIQEQTALQMREDGGKFELVFLPGAVEMAGSYLPDFLPDDGTGITCSTESSNLAIYSCDDNEATFWFTTAACPQWIKLDLGVGVTKIARQIRIKPRSTSGDANVKNFRLQGSNDDSTWYDLVSGTHSNNTDWEQWSISLHPGYRYYKLTVDSIYWSGNRASIYEWELKEIDSGEPPPLPEGSLIIDKNIYVEEPVFEFTPASEVRNLIRATYDLDYGNNGDRRRFGDYLGQIEVSDANSITQYGELSEEIAFPAITDSDVVTEVINWRLVQKKDTIPMVSLVCNRMVRALERNDYFVLSDSGVAAWEDAIWRILEIKETPDRQHFAIKAIKYVGS
jgi:hypothetical protein